jgi:hypothetical protein
MLEIVIDRLHISPNAGLKWWEMGWKDLKPLVKRIDLTQYTGKRSALIFRGKMTSGSFESMHLKLKETKGVLTKSGSAVPVKNAVEPMKLPFSIRQGNRTVIVLDFTVLDMSDHPPSGYELHIKGYELYSDGRLVSKMPQD